MHYTNHLVKPPPDAFNSTGKGADLRRVTSFNTSSVGNDKLSNSSTISNFGSDLRPGQKLLCEGLFKVLFYPIKPRNPKQMGRRQIKEEERSTTVDDVSGSGNSTRSTSVGKRTAGKRIQKYEEGLQVEETTGKRGYQLYQTSHHAPTGPSKTHPEYKDAFDNVDHGIYFALPVDLNIFPVELRSMEILVLLHIEMYTGKIFYPLYSDEPDPEAWVP